MRRVLSILVVAAIIVAIAWYVAGLPGRVSVTFGATHADASVPATILVIALAFLALSLVLRLIGLVFGAPRRLRRWRLARNRTLGDQAVTQALLALAAGEPGDARREAARARRSLGDTPQTLLLTAEAGRLAGREAEATLAFRTLSERQDAAFLGLRGLLRQAVARQDWTEAAALAARAEAAHPGAAWLREERTRLAIRAGQWRDALVLAGPDAPRAAYAAAAAAEEDADPAESLRLAKQAFRDDPGLAPAALTYARRLRERGQEGRAEAVLRRAWAANPQPDIAAAALGGMPDALGRLKAASRLAKSNPEHPESALLLARANLDAGLTGEARRYAERARGALNERRVWMLLAEIEEHENGTSDAARAALRHAAEASPDPSWRCVHCGTALPAWSAACPACHTAGQVRWTTPGAAVAVEATDGQ